MKHPKKYSRGFKAVRFFDSLSLGTLANEDVVGGDMIGGQQVIDDMWLYSIRSNWTVDDLTVGQGPIIVGVAHGDYTDAEIEEWIEANASISQQNLVENEQARRKIRQVGVFSGAAVAESLNDGKPIKTKLGFVLQSGETLRMWAYNFSGDALSVTVPVIRALGSLFMRRA